MAGSDEVASALLSSLPEDERARSLHLVEADGSVRSAGDAVLAIAAALTGTRPRPGPGVRRAAALVYWVVARRRGPLGRLVPDRPPVRRFRR